MNRKIFMLFILFTLCFYSTQAQPVKFSTDFEAGSLDSAQLVQSAWIKYGTRDSVQQLTYNIYSKFDPENPLDTKLPPSGRWFYFKMTSVKGKELDLTFHNTDPLRCMYSYDNVTFNRLDPDATPERGRIVTQFDKDEVYLAYYIPYTFTYLQKRLTDWVAKAPEVTKLETFGQSTQGRPLQLLNITDNNADNSTKKRIWVQGRIHTSESPASWHLDGFIEALIANTPEAQAIRKSTIFYIVPYTNPDGVYNGLSRSNINGVNMEINWARPEEQTEQEVKVLKAKMSELIKKDGAFDMYLGMHSQVANSATYWIHKADSTNAKFFQRQMLLTYLTCSNSPDYLAKQDLEYSDVAPRYPEGWIWNTCGDKTLAITFETPYTYYCDNADKPWVSTETLSDFGAKTLLSVADYFGISASNRIIVDNTNAKLGGKWNHVKSTDVVFHGDDCVAPQKVGNKITYRTKSKIASGSYKVYVWYPGEINNETEANTWLYLQDYYHKKDAKLSLKLVVDNLTLNNGKSKLYDAILLVRE